MLCGFVITLGAQQPRQEKLAIERARRVPASALEGGLPKRPFEQWLSQISSGAGWTWEVNDCGEQSGNPEVDRGRDFPMCVEAIEKLAGGQTVVITLAMGTFQKGVTGTPKLLRITIIRDSRYESVAHLSDLPSRITAAR